MLGSDTTGNSQVNAFDYTGDTGEEIFLNSNKSIYGFKSDGSPVDSTAPDGLILSNIGKYIPATNTTVNHKYIIAVSDTGIAFKNKLGTNKFSLGNGISSCPPFVNENTDFVYAGKSNGQIIKINADGIKFNVDSAAGSIKQFSAVSADTFSYITNASKYLVTGNITSPNSTDILIVNNNNDFILNGTKITLNYNVTGINNSPVLADINSDGKQEIIFSNGDVIYAVNANGVLLDNFPVDFNDSISSGVSVADINNDNVYDLIFATSNGDLYAYGINGQVVSGFR